MDKVLDIGEYLIPEAMRATVRDGKVIVTERKAHRITPDEKRCRDCVYYQQGYSVLPYISYVCTRKPKRIVDDRQCYYSASKYGKICGDFEPRG